MNKIYLLLFYVLLTSCSADNLDNNYYLSGKEMLQLKSAVQKIDPNDVEISYAKIATLSKQTLPYSTIDGVRDLEVYQELYYWLSNDVSNFPLLLLYVIEDNKIEGEERCNTSVLLWELSDNLFPNITKLFRERGNFKDIDLIKELLKQINKL